MSETSVRRFVGWCIIALFFLIGVFSFFANKIVTFAYFALGLSYYQYHRIKYCSECTNQYCPLNKKSAAYIFSIKENKPIQDLHFSDINAIKSALPLVIIMLLPLYFIWIWNYFAALFLIGFAGMIYLIYFQTTCKHCTNNCPGNKNQKYWEWKKQKDSK